MVLWITLSLAGCLERSAQQLNVLPDRNLTTWLEGVLLRGEVEDAPIEVASVEIAGGLRAHVAGEALVAALGSKDFPEELRPIYGEAMIKLFPTVEKQETSVLLLWAEALSELAQPKGIVLLTELMDDKVRGAHLAGVASTLSMYMGGMARDLREGDLIGGYYLRWLRRRVEQGPVQLVPLHILQAAMVSPGVGLELGPKLFELLTQHPDNYNVERFAQNFVEQVGEGPAGELLEKLPKENRAPLHQALTRSP